MFQRLPLRPDVDSKLSTDVLRHIVTLKVHALYPDAVQWTYAEDGGSWALLSLVETGASHYDRAAYGDTRFVVLIDGNDFAIMTGLLDRLPGDSFVAKVSDPEAGRMIRSRYGARRTVSFESFTTSVTPAVLPSRVNVERSSVLAADLAQLFERSGYARDELDARQNSGCTWYSVRRAGVPAAGCMVFQNYGPVWEIGGVYTEPSQRRRGLALAIVDSALRDILREGRIPRYQLHSDNAASRLLAGRAGLERFLTVEHYVASGRPGKEAATDAEHG